MHSTTVAILLAAVAAHIAVGHPNLATRDDEVDGLCTGLDGICVPSANCTGDGVTFIDDACPGHGEDIKCCSSLTFGDDGDYREDNESIADNEDSEDSEDSQDFDDADGQTLNKRAFPTPRLPTLASGCKSIAIEGARKIRAQFPGRIKEIGCKRDCSISGEVSEHCTGMANDLLVSSAWGVSSSSVLSFVSYMLFCSVVLSSIANPRRQQVRTTAGQPIAMWILNNRAQFKVKYVMWGQRIWYMGNPVGPWNTWNYQQPVNRGSITKNHWCVLPL